MDEFKQRPMYPVVPHPSKVTLRVWDYDFGIPSVEPESLTLLTLTKLYNVKARIRYSYFPVFYDIPSLQVDSTVITKGPKLMECMLNQLCREREKFSRTQICFIEHFTDYFMRYVGDVLIFDCWINEGNFLSVIEPWYRNVIPFPFAQKYIKTNRRKIQKYFNHLVRGQDPAKYMSQCYIAADYCLKDLENMLNDGRVYLVDNTPSSLDAVVYSYLTIALHIPLQRSQLKKLIEGRRNLVPYIINMRQTHFSYVPGAFRYIEPIYTRLDPLPRYNVVLAAMFTSSAMVVFSISTGLFKPNVPCLTQSMENLIISHNRIINELSLVKSDIVSSFFNLLVFPFGICFI